MSKNQKSKIINTGNHEKVIFIAQNICNCAISAKLIRKKIISFAPIQQN